VRRGELLLTASTGGGAPALAALLRGWLAEAFDERWEARLAELAALRARLRAEGAGPAALVAALAGHVEAEGWLPPPPAG
jgi:siroheme synthase (precorrin-2 oxidase/ferrochelatase)